MSNQWLRQRWPLGQSRVLTLDLKAGVVSAVHDPLQIELTFNIKHSMYQDIAYHASYSGHMTYMYHFPLHSRYVVRVHVCITHNTCTCTCTRPGQNQPSLLKPICNGVGVVHVLCTIHPNQGSKISSRLDNLCGKKIENCGTVDIGTTGCIMKS